MPSKPPRPNPYCGFKNDRERRLALLSRDARFVLVAFLTSGGGYVLLSRLGDWLNR